MSENLDSPTNPTETQRQGTTEYLHSLIEAGIDIPDPAKLQGSLDTLLNEHGLEAAFLNDKPVEALLLTAVTAQGLEADESDGQEKERRQVVLKAILGKYSKDDETNQEARHKEAVDKFTNRELSAQLTEVFRGVLFDDVREGLGVSDGEIVQSIDVRVLDVATNDATALPSLLQFDSEDWALYKDHKEALKKRTKKYTSLIGYFEGEDSMPPAWMKSGHNGERNTIFIPALIAEEMIAHSAFNDAKQEWSSSVSFARHELVHCIDNLFLQDSFFGVGLLLEERRAEYYSGDQNGYLDVKTAVDFVLGTHGLTLDEVLPKDGTYSSSDTYLKLASALGLEDMLDLVTAIPESYVPAFNEAGGFNVQYLKAGNNINDALLRILRRAKVNHGNGYAHTLVGKFVDKKVEEIQANGIDKKYVSDNLALVGPTTLSILAIKDFRQRYPGYDQYDWQSAYGENWAIAI